MNLKLTSLALPFLFCISPCMDYAQTPNPVPALIARSKPAVIAVVFVTVDKLPDEAQLKPIKEYKTEAGLPAYVYISGTGFIVSADGYIVTALHVINGLPNPVQIMLPDETFSRARVVTTSAEHDYAILKADLKNSPFLEFGRFSDVSEGDDVIYIGHPFGEPQKVTSKGMVSWMGNGPWGNTFQLSAIVNGGNSGGPMIEVKSGRVIGTVEAKYGALSPYLKSIEDGTVRMNGNIGGGGFDLNHFVKDVTTMMELHIQMGIGFAVSTEYVKAELSETKQDKK